MSANKYNSFQLSTNCILLKCSRIPALIILLITVSTLTFGQQNKFAFKHLSGADGLFDASVNSIVQDRKGFIWFATNDGLNRYDGGEFRVYKNIPGDTLTLSGNKDESIYLDPEGKLWACTTNGLCLYNRKQDKLNFL